jgi:hypothetical protein
LSRTLELSEPAALAGIRQAHAKVDLQRRREVGAIGEERLVALLEDFWPGSTSHVSLVNDGLGYDIEFSLHGTTWQLEVKSTTRRGRLRIYVSRNEFDVGRLLTNWQLVVLGLGEGNQIEALGTLPVEWLQTVIPRDVTALGRWAAAAIEVSPRSLSPGLAFVGERARDPLVSRGQASSAVSFAWHPAASSA